MPRSSLFVATALVLAAAAKVNAVQMLLCCLGDLMEFIVILLQVQEILKPAAILPPVPQTGAFRQGSGGIPAAKGAAVAHYAAGNVDLSSYSGVDFNNGDVMSVSTPTSIYLIFYVRVSQIRATCAFCELRVASPDSVAQNGPGTSTPWTPSQIVDVAYFVNHLFRSHFGSILETYTDIAGFPISAYKIRVTDSVIVHGKKGVLGGTVGSEDVLGIIISQLHSKRLPLVSTLSTVRLRLHAWCSCVCSASVLAELKRDLHCADGAICRRNECGILYARVRLAQYGSRKQGHPRLRPTSVWAAHPLCLHWQPANALPA